MWYREKLANAGVSVFLDVARRWQENHIYAAQVCGGCYGNLGHTHTSNLPLFSTAPVIMRQSAATYRSGMPSTDHDNKSG